MMQRVLHHILVRRVGAFQNVCSQHAAMFFHQITRPPAAHFSYNSHQGGENLDDVLSWDDAHVEVSDKKYLLPDEGHKVFIIQPDFKQGKRKYDVAKYQLDEACSLIDALPGWTVAGTMIKSLKTDATSKYIFGRGGFIEVQQEVRQCQSATAVFFALDMLTGLQLSILQSAYVLPVYDRYTIVLQIFKHRARTMEAKLQIALAEIPFYKSRLVGVHKGTLDQQRGSLGAIGGSGEKVLEIKQRYLHDKELKLKKELTKLKSQRQLLRVERKKKDLPIVAVVGYTNAGKTSLIQALTGSDNLQPEDKVFATLDVTVHAALLNKHLRVLFTDTVGFISDVPTALIESFASTLEDIRNADIIIHIRDISHPETEKQRRVVMETLQQLQLPSHLLENIIEVCNKMDLIQGDLDDASTFNNALPVSILKGEGLDVLVQKVHDEVIRCTGREERRLLIPMKGDHLNWLYREADVVQVEPAEGNSEKVLVTVVMTDTAYAKFRAKFKSKKNK